MFENFVNMGAPNRVQQAVAQYVEALRAWRPGGELMALAHAWMAAEALTKLLLEREMKRVGVATVDEFAARHSIEKKEVDSFIRKTVVFHGDEATFKKTKTASDEFEHGYTPIHTLKTDANHVAPDALQHVRRTLIELLAVPGEETCVFVGHRCLRVPVSPSSPGTREPTPWKWAAAKRAGEDRS